MPLGTKYIVRAGVIGAIALGTAAAVAGPSRLRALFDQTRESINSKIDENITDPVALRSQIKDLEAQYPKRIAEVRGDLAKLREQVSQLNRDLAISNRVVQMADSDSIKLTSAIDQARMASVQIASFSGPSVTASEIACVQDAPQEPTSKNVVILFKNERIDIPTAETKRMQVDATRNAYASRAADIQRDLGYLSQQERQLTSLSTRLENEYTSFQTQVFDLDRQIDAIGRNDRMISIMKDRQGTLDEQSRYRAASLDAITTKLADVRARQEATLLSLSKVSERYGYEQDAKASLDREAAVRGQSGVRSNAVEQPASNRRDTIEIDASKAAPVAPVAPTTSEVSIAVP